MMTFKEDKIYKHVAELQLLAELHYKESRPYEDIPLNINWLRYINAEANGNMKSYFAVQDNKIIGYAGFAIGYATEYSTTFQASLLNIFIHPDHRGNGGKFIKWCDEQLKELGIRVVYHHVKAKNDYGVLLKRLGYDIMNIEYAKRLDI